MSWDFCWQSLSHICWCIGCSRAWGAWLSLPQILDPGRRCKSCIWMSVWSQCTTLMAESKEKLKSLLMRMKEEGERASLKLNINETKIMLSGPIAAAVRSWLTHLTSVCLSPSLEEGHRGSGGDSRLLFNHRASLLGPSWGSHALRMAWNHRSWSRLMDKSCDEGVSSSAMLPWSPRGSPSSPPPASGGLWGPLVDTSPQSSVFTGLDT